MEPLRPHLNEEKRWQIMDDRIRGKRILVVDYEHDLTLFYRLSLEFYGFEVESKSFKADNYDLIILDI